MFGSVDAKKRFQKPNILRKKPKCSSKVSSAGRTSFATNNLVNTTSGTKEHSKVTQEPVQIQKINDELFSNKSLNVTRNEELSIVLDGTNNNQECASQNPVNIELFINDSQSSQNNYQYDIYNDIGSQIKHDWAFDFTNGSQEVIIERFDGSEVNEDLETNTSVTMVPLSEISSSKHVENNTTENIQNLPGNNFTIEYTMNFKCDVPNCNKRFKSEENLARHKFIHNAQSSSALLPKPTNFECPVKKVTDEGTDVPCGMTFFTREELVEHLNESHSPNDASYMCGSCGRAFFWAVGLRSHARARCAAPRLLACGWPGCGRVFRQPCRLREHTRKHTGDKPYPCRFPNCSWSFRTASKLVRHARRHTGERRHVCAACGRGFLRREHLKDHLARHKAHTHACRHQGCQRTFTNLGALLTHMKKMHRDDTSVEPETPATLDDTTSTEQTYFVSLEMSPLEGEAPPAASDPAMAVADAADADADPDADEDADAGAESQWHAARTHCTWPLPPRAAAEPYEAANQYILEEDVQVELSEGSESNIYTIRSDLFLHGNILNNEDSEHIPGAGAAGAEAEAEAGADAGLGLLDAHPTIDLMPEELLYTDAAVDESSFRVFLLSGEEIQIV